MKKSRSRTNSTLTTYLLDVQPGLYTVLASTTGPDTTRFVKHGTRSLRQEVDGQWQHLLTDGLGGRDAQLGVRRSVLDANHLPLETIHYTPHGVGAPTESLHGSERVQRAPIYLPTKTAYNDGKKDSLT